jgi:hypothetical protein
MFFMWCLSLWQLSFWSSFSSSFKETRIFCSWRITDTYINILIQAYINKSQIHINYQDINILACFKEWKWPVNEELQYFLAKIKATNPHSLEAEGFCRGGSLGLYLVLIYIYVYTYIYLHQNIYTFINICMYKHILIFIYIWTNIYISIGIFMHINPYVHVYMYLFYP